MTSPTPPAAIRSRALGNELGLLLAVFAVVGLTMLVSDSYIEKPWYNAKEILRQTAFLGIFALGAATVIIAGGIDLSAGSVIAFSATICASIIILLAPVENAYPVTEDLSAGILTAAVLGTLFVAVLIGTLHTWLITIINLPPFVATLASLVGLRSLARVLIRDVNRVATGKATGNTQIYIYDETFGNFGEWWVAAILFFITAGLLWVLLSRTVTGRHLYALGGNEEAARLSGIRVVRLKWLAYCISSVTAAVAGILICGYVGLANPVTQGVGYELNAIAAAVVGGCSLAGGSGSVVGTMLGALFLRVVIDSVAKTVRQDPDQYQGLVVGFLVVLAVAFNQLQHAGGLRKHYFAGALGLVTIGILSVLSGTVAGLMAETRKFPTAVVTGLAILVILGIRFALERRSAAAEARGE